MDKEKKAKKECLNKSCKWFNITLSSSDIKVWCPNYCEMTNCNKEDIGVLSEGGNFSGKDTF